MIVNGKFVENFNRKSEEWREVVNKGIVRREKEIVEDIKNRYFMRLFQWVCLKLLIAKIMLQFDENEQINKSYRN